MPVLQACHRCGRPSDGRYCLRADCQAAKRAVRAHLNRPGRGTKAATDLRRATFERDDYQCVQCGSADHLERDHIVPVAVGGADTLANSQTLCRRCNRRKGASS